MLFLAALAGHCLMVIMLFLHFVHRTDTFIVMTPIGHDQRMLENAGTGVLHPLLDAVMRLALAAGIYNIMTKTSYSPNHDHAVILRALEFDWSIEDCPEMNSIDNQNFNVREVPSTHHGGRNLAGSKLRPGKCVNVKTLIAIKATFDGREEVHWLLRLKKCSLLSLLTLKR